MDANTSHRKDEHLDINLREDISSGITTGLEEYHFLHQALPEINLEDVNLSLNLLANSCAPRC